MSVSQFYETTLVQNEDGLSASFIVVPTRSIPENQRFGEPAAIVEALSLREFTPIRPGYFLRAAAFCLAAETSDFLSSWPQLDRDQVPGLQVLHKHYTFAEYLMMMDVVPFESSPLSTESLGKLITSPSGVGIGAFAGFVAAGNTPLLFVLVPAGMILFGAAAGVARALEEGLRERLVELLRTLWIGHSDNR